MATYSPDHGLWRSTAINIKCSEKTLVIDKPLSVSLYQCSVPCGVGQRKREVMCVDNLGDIVADEECNMALRPQDLQNCDKGVCASSWFYSLWSDRVRHLCVFLWYVAVVLLKQLFMSLCSVLQTVRKEVAAGRWCV